MTKDAYDDTTYGESAYDFDSALEEFKKDAKTPCVPYRNDPELEMIRDYPRLKQELEDTIYSRDMWRGEAEELKRENAELLKKARYYIGTDGE